MGEVRGAALASLVALVGGLALGIAVSATQSGVGLAIVPWVEPIGTIWVTGVRMTVIPLVVASLVVAVAGVNARTVGQLGTRSFVIFTALLSAMALITALVAPALFATGSVDPVAAAALRGEAAALAPPELPSLASWFVSLVPANPIKAAVEGAMLPLLVFSIAFGLALGQVAAPRRDAVVGFFSGVADAMTGVVRAILMVAPIGIFALAFPLAVRLGGGMVATVGLYLAVHASLLVVAALLCIIAVVLTGSASLGRFVRAALPAQVVALTTRSSMAALPAMLTAAEGPLGLPTSLTRFALPLGVSAFRLNQAVSWVVMALFASQLYGVPLSGISIATLAVTSVLMSFSVPGIPSGSLFVIAPFFAGVGIPPEAVGVLIAIDLIPDLFKTVANVTGHLAAVTILGRWRGAEPSPDPGPAVTSTR